MDVRPYQQLLAFLEKGLVSGADADEMLDLMCEAFGLCGLVLGSQFHYDAWHLIGGDIGDWPERHAEVAEDDPCGDYLHSSPVGSWFVFRQVPHELRHNATSDMFLRAGFNDVAIGRLPTVGGVELTTALYRQKPNQPYDDRDLFFLSLIYPHWLGALSTRTALAAIQEPETENRNDALRRFKGHAFLSFPQGTVEWTAKAKQLLELRLGAISEHGWARLEKALFRAAVVNTRSCGLSSRSPLLSNLCLEFAHVPPAPGEQRRMLVLFVEDDAIPTNLGGTSDARSSAETLLSPRQREVARLVARGLTLPEAAQRLGIGVETVRHHYANSLRRLGITRRSDLRSLLDPKGA
jgi:DNA-binding CsgD family transcriptional regulator